MHIQVESKKSNYCLSSSRINLGTYQVAFMKKVKDFKTTSVLTMCDKNALSYTSET